MKAFVSILTGFFLAIIIGMGTASAATPSTSPTRVESAGGVTVRVALLHGAESETRFDVALDTHSVNLDSYDLKGLAVLRDGTGRTYEPIRIENKGSGHHREFIVAFPKIDPAVKKIELVIKDLAGVKERSFSWEL